MRGAGASEPERSEGDDWGHRAPPPEARASPRASKRGRPAAQRDPARAREGASRRAPGTPKGKGATAPGLTLALWGALCTGGEEASGRGLSAAGESGRGRRRRRSGGRHGEPEKRRRQNEPPPGESAYILSLALAQDSGTAAGGALSPPCEDAAECSRNVAAHQHERTLYVAAAL